MKAISIRQPWAWAIIYAGKTVENRNWATKYRGPILIHAAQKMLQEEYDTFCNYYRATILAKWPDRPEPPAFAALLRGGVIGKARINGCVHERDSRFLCTDDKPWFFGPNGIILNSVAPLPFVRCRGALGLFEIPDALIVAESV